MREQELAAKIVAHLEREGWDIYQEVQFGGWRADVVAVRGPHLHVVEVKAVLSLEVLAQARRWIREAHLVSVAVPRPKRHQDGRSIATDYLRWKGIGLYTLKDWPSKVVDEEIAPTLREAATAEKLRATLQPEHKTFAKAGAPGGGHFTDYKRTASMLAALATAEPGIALGEAIDRIDHHYASKSSARGALGGLLSDGKVAGVRGAIEGRVMRLYPAEATR